MKRQLALLVMLALTRISMAETALICGSDLDKIETKNKAARVHIDFDYDKVANKNDIKFFDVFGRAQQVVAASTVLNNQFILISTQQEQYLFHNPNYYGCSKNGRLQVLIKPSGKKIKCRCFQG